MIRTVEVHTWGTTGSTSALVSVQLYSIAFHALPVDSNTVLMDKYQLQQYTSTRQVVLREQEKQNSKPQRIVLFGDATFDLDSFIHLDRRSSAILSTTSPSW